MPESQQYKDKVKAEQEAIKEATKEYDELVATLILIGISKDSLREKNKLIKKYQEKLLAFNRDFAQKHIESAYKQFAKEAIDDIREFEKVTGKKAAKLNSVQKQEMKNLVNQLETSLNKRLSTIIEDAKRLALKEDLSRIREKKMGFKNGNDQIQITAKKAKPDLVFVNAQGKKVKMEAVMKVTVGDQLWQTIFDAKRATYLLSGYRYVRHISIIDERTTEICKALNRKIRDLTRDKIPPMHYGCRSEIELLPKDFKP